MELLLEHDKLIFTYDDLLEGKPLRCRSAEKFEKQYMVAEQLGMQVFLLTDCLINKNDADISQYPHGDVDALTAYLTQVCGLAE